MAKVKIVKEEVEENQTEQTPEQQASSFLRSHKADHYNFEETITYKVPSSSLILTAAMNGGCGPGANRAMGITAGGKTSCTLDFMYHFLQNNKGHRGLYVKSEGRLSDEVKLRSGITFVLNPDEWKDGTCLVLESNVYEFVFGFMGDLIRNNPQKTRYFFMIDSMDMMGKREDLAKGLESAAQVAGGALLTSTFLKQTSVGLAKRGHICWFIAQVRDSIKINPYEKSNPRQGTASGGHAIEHAGEWVFEFLPRWNDDIIRETPSDKSSKPIGHYCKIRIIKSNNEKYNYELAYPIKYGRTGAKSVWVEREIVDLLIMWGYFEKKGAWFKITENIRKPILEAGLEFPELIQGMDNIYKVLEDSAPLTKCLYDFCYNKIMGT